MSCPHTTAGPHFCPLYSDTGTGQAGFPRPAVTHPPELKKPSVAPITVRPLARETKEEGEGVRWPEPLAAVRVAGMRLSPDLCSLFPPGL